MKSRLLFKSVWIAFVVLFLLGTNVPSAVAQYYPYPYPFPYYRPNYLPYQTIPPYPGAIPLYYDRNVPVYDYTPHVDGYGANFVDPYAYTNRNLSNRAAPRHRPPVQRMGDFDNDGIPDAVAPHVVRVVPHNSVPDDSIEDVATKAQPDRAAPEKPLRPRTTRTWKTLDGELFENAFIVGVVDKKLYLKTPEGHRYYVAIGNLDDDSRKALEEWRQHR